MVRQEASCRDAETGICSNRDLLPQCHAHALHMPPFRIQPAPVFLMQGKKRFDKALQQLEGRADVDVTFHPFIIDHGTAPGGGWRAWPAEGAPLFGQPAVRYVWQVCWRTASSISDPCCPPSPSSRAGEEYLAYNVRRWGGDGWCHDLRRSGRPDGALFANWRWWPASAKGHQLLLLAQQQGLGRQCKELLLHKT